MSGLVRFAGDSCDGCTGQDGCRYGRPNPQCESEYQEKAVLLAPSRNPAMRSAFDHESPEIR
jgi:hypothetical protein